MKYSIVFHKPNDFQSPSISNTIMNRTGEWSNSNELFCETIISVYISSQSKLLLGYLLHPNDCFTCRDMSVKYDKI